MQRPVEISQVFTLPSESLEMTIPSLVCRETDMIEAEVGGVVIVPVIAGSVDESPICQNLTDLSGDAEMRKEENARELMPSLCPMKVLVG